MNPFLFAAAGTADGGTGGLFSSGGSMILMLVVMGAALYFLMFRPQKKREQQQKDMRNSITVGDEVTTIGGVVGRVVSIKEDTFVIETAGDRSRMRFKRWAIQEVNKLSMEGEGDAVSSGGTAAASDSGSIFGNLFKGFGKKKDSGSDGSSGGSDNGKSE